MKGEPIVVSIGNGRAGVTWWADRCAICDYGPAVQIIAEEGLVWTTQVTRTTDVNGAEYVQHSLLANGLCRSFATHLCRSAPASPPEESMAPVTPGTVAKHLVEYHGYTNPGTSLDILLSAHRRQHDIKHEHWEED